MSQNVRDLLRLKGLLLSMTHPVSSQKKPDSTYEDKLNEIRQFFPSPTSDHLQTVHLSQLINRTLSNINQLKTTFPFYGKREPLNHEFIENNTIPNEISNLEQITDDLGVYLAGHFNWANPKVQKNVVTSVTILSIIAQIIAYFYVDSVPHGISTIIVLILFFGGLNMLAISIIGEYQAKILEETKRRPKYIRKNVYRKRY